VGSAQLVHFPPLLCPLVVARYAHTNLRKGRGAKSTRGGNWPLPKVQSHGALASRPIRSGLQAKPPILRVCLRILRCPKGSTTPPPRNKYPWGGVFFNFPRAPATGSRNGSRLLSHTRLQGGRIRSPQVLRRRQSTQRSAMSSAGFPYELVVRALKIAKDPAHEFA